METEENNLGLSCQRMESNVYYLRKHGAATNFHATVDGGTHRVTTAAVQPPPPLQRASSTSLQSIRRFSKFLLNYAVISSFTLNPSTQFRDPSPLSGAQSRGQTRR